MHHLLRPFILICWLLASLGSAWAGGRSVSTLMRVPNPHQGFYTSYNGSTNPNHRYGFQGEESDDEMYGDGNAIAFTYRVHDPRIGRFLSVDPLSPEYPWNSPYAFSENRVIDAVELEGLEKALVSSVGIDGTQKEGGHTSVDYSTPTGRGQVPVIYHSGGAYGAIVNGQVRVSESGYYTAQDYGTLMYNIGCAHSAFIHTTGYDDPEGAKQCLLADCIDEFNAAEFDESFIYSGLGSLAAGIEAGIDAVERSRRGSMVPIDPIEFIMVGQGVSSLMRYGAGYVMNRLTVGGAARGGYVNLASSGRTAHIIAGDATGGGHAWFGSFKSFANGLTGSKSMFPATWNNSKIMHAVSDVAVNNQWIQQTGKAGAMFTKSGQPVRFVVEGTYEGTKIRVITTHTDIIIAFPIK
ncbi:MAG: EndoU domain-containing protein [Bacteroidia bacterium]|nr:EndoU domain-containing protein [Bacteroidia bacterium]